MQIRKIKSGIKRFLAGVLTFVILLGIMNSNPIDMQAEGIPVEVDLIGSSPASSSAAVYGLFRHDDISDLTWEENWNTRYKPANAESGIFVNGSSMQAPCLNAAGYAFLGPNGIYLEWSGALEVNDYIIVKGTFYCESTGQSFTLRNATRYTWLGETEKWLVTYEGAGEGEEEEILLKQVTVTNAVKASSTAGLYVIFNGEDIDGLTADPQTWSVRFKPADSNSGLFVNGSETPVACPQQGGYAFLGTPGLYLEGFGTFNAGDYMIMKGTFRSMVYDEAFVLRKPTRFTWTGEEWKVTYEEVGRELDVDGATIKMGGTYGDNAYYTLSASFTSSNYITNATEAKGTDITLQYTVNAHSRVIASAASIRFGLVRKDGTETRYPQTAGVILQTTETDGDALHGAVGDTVVLTYDYDTHTPSPMPHFLLSEEDKTGIPYQTVNSENISGVMEGIDETKDYGYFGLGWNGGSYTVDYTKVLIFDGDNNDLGLTTYLPGNCNYFTATRMGTVGEKIYVQPKEQDSSKAIGLEITDATGNILEVETVHEGGDIWSFIMPDADVTVSPIYEGVLTDVDEYTSEQYEEYRQNMTNVPTKDGYTFAGWYADEACEKVLSADTVDGTAYAKFVDDDVLVVKAQVLVGTDANAEQTDIRFLTTVDSLEYVRVGFDITVEGREKMTTSSSIAYETLNVSNGESVEAVDASVISPASNYFVSYVCGDIPNADFDTKFTITPYWITLDGTTVYGKTTVKSVGESYNELTIPDFLVEVESGRDPVVLQLTDTQIIDAAQTREGRDGVYMEYWATDMKEERCYDYLTETIRETNPDLILVTGDFIYGEFDDSGSVLRSFVSFMDSFGIPWAPVFGNHEIESKKGVDWQCEQLKKAEYCLFEQRELTGNGNYTVGVKQDGELKRVFFMLDSNGSARASEESLANGHTVKTVGFGEDQIAWYTETAQKITSIAPETKLSFAFHIQLAVFADAFEKYGYDNNVTDGKAINIDTYAEKAEGDFGYLGRNLKDAWDGSYEVWNGLKALGVDSIFVGHEHCNSASVVFEGVRFQYGQKSSTYDRANFMIDNGLIVGGYAGDVNSNTIPLIGGTVLPLSAEDGSISDPYIYLCKNAGGSVDWDYINKDEDQVIKVLSLGNSFSMDAQRYLHQIAEADGVDLRATNLALGGCNLEKHVTNMNANEKAYELWINGLSTAFMYSFPKALQAQDWDYITFQQVSQESINYDTFQPYLNELVAYAREVCPNAKILLHETWAYEAGSNRLMNELGYATPDEMYDDIHAAYAQAAIDVRADGILPSGTLFQSLLSNGVEELHRDTYHATVGTGRYALGLMWYKVLTGNDVTNNTYSKFDKAIPEEDIAIIKQCVEDVYEDIY